MSPFLRSCLPGVAIVKYCELFHHNVDWTQHEVSFGVWEEGKCTGLLRIIPLGCELGEQREDPDAPRYTAYGIYSQVKVETNGFDCTAFDFISPSCYKDLYRLFMFGKESAPGAIQFAGQDGGVEIDFRWREEGDLSVVGHLPSPAYSIDHLLARDPLLLRKYIKTNVQFEFLVPPDKLEEASAELETLLAYVRSVEEKESR
jgi:hypothetical protein